MATHLVDSVCVCDVDLSSLSTSGTTTLDLHQMPIPWFYLVLAYSNINPIHKLYMLFID